MQCSGKSNISKYHGILTNRGRPYMKSNDGFYMIRPCRFQMCPILQFIDKITFWASLYNDEVKSPSNGCYLILISSLILEAIEILVDLFDQHYIPRLILQMHVCGVTHPKINSNQSQILHYALKDTTSSPTWKKLFWENIDFWLFLYWGHLAYY